MRIAKIVPLVVALVPLAAFGITVNVTVSNFTFTPSTVTIAPGDTVSWNFTSLHSSTSDSTTGPEVWDSGPLSTGSFTHTFTSAGTFTYHCTIHPFMTGSVKVAAAAPTLTSISPATASTAGGTAVTLSGTNFATGCTVDFGGIAASNVLVPASTTITATTPAHAAGTVNVDVVCTAGSATLTNGFTFTTVAAVPAMAGYLVVLLAIVLAGAGLWVLRE